MVDLTYGEPCEFDTFERAFACANDWDASTEGGISADTGSKAGGSGGNGAHGGTAGFRNASHDQAHDGSDGARGADDDHANEQPPNEGQVTCQHLCTMK